MRALSLRLLASLLLLAPGAHADTSEARIARFDGDRAAAVTYTFDDNLRDQYTLAVPMLNEIGIKGTFFVIPAATAQTVEEGEKKNLKQAWGGITWSELKEMADQGHEIGSHTWSHPNMQKLTPEEVDLQLKKSYDVIKERLGKPPLTIAFPFNATTPEIQAATAKYYVGYRSAQLATAKDTTADSLNAWAEKQVKEKRWGVVMIHGIAAGYAALGDPEILRTHWKYVKDRESDIWIDTFANVARYEKERDDAKLTVTEEGDHLVCTLVGTLNPDLYDVPLTLVLDAKRNGTARVARDGVELPARIDREKNRLYIQAAPNPQPITVTWN